MLSRRQQKFWCAAQVSHLAKLDLVTHRPYLGLGVNNQVIVASRRVLGSVLKRQIANPPNQFEGEQKIPHRSQYSQNRVFMMAYGTGSNYGTSINYC